MYIYDDSKTLNENFKLMLNDYNLVCTDVINNKASTDIDVNLIKEQSYREKNIEKLIREKYSLSQEIRLLRSFHLGLITEDEFKEYSDYVEECIKKVPELND